MAVPPVLADLVCTPNAPNRSGRGGRTATQTSTRTRTTSRYLLPLRQDTELFQALETQTFQYERAHRFARQRNGSGADSTTTRPKRRGVGWQQLRADATVLSDWTRACFRQGWLPIPGMTQRNTHEPVAISGAEGLAGLKARRLTLNLHRPYGYRARWFGHGPVRLPQPDGVTLPVPDITKPPLTDGQRHTKGGRPRPLTPLPDELPDLPLWAEMLAPSSSKTAGSNAEESESATQDSDASPPEPEKPLSAEERRQQRARANWGTRSKWDTTGTSDPRSPPQSGAGPPDDPDDVPF